ncbi:MAG TPA: hypothetical protein VKA08_01050 [Balneolales bacterium]|nr:hypothetical protein [Balneolales bacterium]
MRLVDPHGNEVTSHKNEKADELEQQFNQKIEKVLEPILNRIQLSGNKISEQQLIQLHSVAHQILFNRLVFNMVSKIGIDTIDGILKEDDIKELQTSLSNQLRIVDPSEAMNMKNQDPKDS